MKRQNLITIAVVIIAVLIGGFLLFNGKFSKTEIIQNTTSPNSVELLNLQFNPSVINVKVGDTVTWTNKDSVIHTVTSYSGNELSSKILKTGETYSHTFTKAGTFNYYCSIHVAMKAKVIVE